jgi:signal transduction histidine kinase
VPEAARQRVALGDTYARARLDERAITAYARAAAAAPAWHVPLQRLGRAHHRLGELAEASRAYEHALELRPSAELERQLAQVALDGRDLGAAETHLTRALEMDPEDPFALYQRGHVRLRSGRPQAAREDFATLNHLDVTHASGRAPSLHQILEGLAAAHAACGDLAAADQALADSIALRPNDPQLHLARARILATHSRHDGRLEERILAALDEALRLDPDFVLARRMRAWRLARRRTDRPEGRARAIADLEHIAETARSPGAAPLPRAELARTYFALGSLYDDSSESAEAALAAYARGEALDSSRPESANNVGVIHRQRGEEGAAIVWLCEAVARDPDYDRAYHNLALVLHQSPDPARAWEAILQAFPGSAPRASEVVARVAAALVEVGRAEVYEALYTGGHRLKNVLGVLGDRLRRLAALAGGDGAGAGGGSGIPVSLTGLTPPGAFAKPGGTAAPGGAVEGAGAGSRGGADRTGARTGARPASDLGPALLEASRSAVQLYDDWTGYLDRMKSEALALEAIDAGDLLRAVARATSSPGRKVTTELSSGASPVLRADRVKLVDALTNVVLNALEAAGEATLRMSLPGAEGAGAAPAARVRIEVIDHGPGIPEAIRRKIFTPGFTTKEKGSGFGLTIAARVVHLHQGKIAVESPASPDGRGTRVVIDLPTDLAAVAPAARAARPALRSLAVEGGGAADHLAPAEEFVS